MQALAAPVVTDVSESLEILSHDDEIGLDIETGGENKGDGLSPFRGKIAVVSMFGKQTGRSCVIHTRNGFPDTLRDFLSSGDRLFILHNGPNFDLPFLSNAGVDIFAGRFYDTLIGECVCLTSGRRDVSVALDATIKRRLNRVIDKGLATSNWLAPTLSEAQVAYAASDVMHLPAVRQAQLEICVEDSRIDAMELEQALIPVGARMVLNGIPIDLKRLEEYSDKKMADALKYEKLIIEEYGAVNCNSPAQVVKLFHSRGFPIANSEESTLANLAEGPNQDIAWLARAVLAVRTGKKRGNMYRDDWIGKYVHDGRVHGTFWQISTDTGRFSSRNPNMQQFPRDMREPQGAVFGGEEGMMVCAADYSQIEAGVAAHLARDKVMLAAYQSEDIHRFVASKIYRKSPVEVTKYERQVAKSATFHLIFGGGWFGLIEYAMQYGVKLSPEESKEITSTFFAEFPGLLAMKQRAVMAIQRVKDSALLSNHTPTYTLKLPTGMKRVLIADKLKPTVLLNTSVQGTAAAILKNALLLCHERGLDRYIGAVVHDEIVATVPTSYAEEYTSELVQAMIDGGARVMSTPVKAEGGYGEYWAK